MTSATLSLTQTLSLLRDLHNVPPAGEVPVFARLKNFKQAFAFPSGGEVGRGRRAPYGPRQIIELVVAFELLQCGQTPARIVETVRRHPLIRQAAANCATLNDLSGAFADALMLNMAALEDTACGALGGRNRRAVYLDLPRTFALVQTLVDDLLATRIAA